MAIESIYLDSQHVRETSRYVLLTERLAELEQAAEVHHARCQRVTVKYKTKIQEAKQRLEAEGERLRKALERSKARP